MIKLIDYMGDDTTPIKRARVSYNGDLKDFSEEKDNALLNRLMKEKHYGVLEGNVFTFMIKTAIPIARQIMRSRTFSYNEISRRYLDDEHTPFQFQIPEPRGDKNKELENFDYETYYSIFQQIYNEAINNYNKLRELGVAKEIVRYVIPQGMITRFYMTGNLRNWLHFLELRTSEHAQKEIRDIANKIKEEITKIVPKIMEAYENNK